MGVWGSICHCMSCLLLLYCIYMYLYGFVTTVYYVNYRASELDDVLVKIFFVKPKKRLSSMIRKAEKDYVVSYVYVCMVVICEW